MREIEPVLEIRPPHWMRLMYVGVYVLVQRRREIRLEASTLPTLLDVFGASEDDRFAEYLRRLQMWLGSFP